MSVSSTLPLKVADTGPILVLTMAAKPFSPLLSSDSQPGMQAFSTLGSLSSAQTFGLSAGNETSPVIVMAMDVPFLRGLDPSAAAPPLAPAQNPRAIRRQLFASRRKDQDVAASAPDLRPSCAWNSVVISDRLGRTALCAERNIHLYITCTE